MSGPVFIDGDSIDLRTVEKGDIEFLKRGVNHPEVRKYVQGFRTPVNDKRFERVFENVHSGENSVTLLVCDSDEPVGSVMFAPMRDDHGRAELGCWIHPDEQENRYATEASELLIEYGFEELRLNRITAPTLAPNVASRRVLERLGFSREGVLREHTFADGEYVDVHHYGLLKDEWRKRKKS